MSTEIQAKQQPGNGEPAMCNLKLQFKKIKALEMQDDYNYKYYFLISHLIEMKYFINSLKIICRQHIC